MDPGVTRKELYRKYAKILQIPDIKRVKTPPKQLVYPPTQRTAKTPSHVELAQKYLQLKQDRSGYTSPKAEMSSTSFRFHGSRLKGSPSKTEMSLIQTPSPKLFASASEHRLATSNSVLVLEDKQADQVRTTPTKSLTKIDWSDLSNPKKFELRETRERAPATTSMEKSRKEYYPYGEKPLTLEDLYSDARNISEELKSIATQEHEQTLKVFMKHLNVKEFIKIQKMRIDTAIKVIEKGFVQKIVKENKVKQETWNLVSAEFQGIKSAYDDFLFTLEEAYDKASKSKKKVDDSLKPWEALNMLVEYSPIYRATQDNPSEESQRNMDMLMKSIYHFKVDYRISREFKPRVLEIYGLVEKHIKDLNQSIDNERGSAAHIVEQKKQLIQERKDIEAKNDKLKNEMMETIKEWKTNAIQAQQQSMPVFQEKFFQNKIDHLQAEFDKAVSDNNQLYKDLKESRQELKRLAFRDEKIVKASKDKAIMVDLYSKETLAPVTVGLSTYLTELELCKDGSGLPKELVNSMLSLIYSDKMISDLCDDHARRPRRTLGAYLPEWFLKKFGVYSFSEMLLRDLMCNVNSTARNNDKYKVFRELAGVDIQNGLDTFKYTLDGQSKPDKLRLKKIAFCTAEMCRQFCRIVNCIKTCWQSEMESPIQTHSYGPYLPNVPPKKEMLSMETVNSVLQIIGNEEKFSRDEVKDVEDFLYLTQQNDIYGRETNGKPGNDEPEEGSNGMRFDLFVKFLMEVILQKRIEKLDKFYTSFKSRMAQKQKNLSYEEFKQTIDDLTPGETQSWKDHSFAQLMNQYSSHKVPLLKLMENFVKCYFHEDQAKDLYQKLHEDRYKKREVLSLRLEKNTSSKQSISPRKPPPNQANQNALQPNYAKPRLLNSAKEAFGLGEPELNEQGYALYDTVSSLIVLQETYSMIEDRIVLAEKSTDGVIAAHEAFSKSLALLPKKVCKLDKLDSLVIFGKEELVDFVEQLWTKFRIVLALTFRSK